MSVSLIVEFIWKIALRTLLYKVAARKFSAVVQFVAAVSFFVSSLSIFFSHLPFHKFFPSLF